MTLSDDATAAIRTMDQEDGRAIFPGTSPGLKEVLDRGLAKIRWLDRPGTMVAAELTEAGREVARELRERTGDG